MVVLQKNNERLIQNGFNSSDNGCYPRIEINVKNIEENTRKIVELCKESGIEVAAVTKLVCGHPEIAKRIASAGVEMLADARVENIEKYESNDISKLMLRLPMRSQVNKVVDICSTSLVSDFEMMQLLSEAAVKKGLVHDIIVMIDMGDLREGLFSEQEIHETFSKVKELEGICVKGVGVNLSCYGGVMPTQDLLKKLVTMKDQLNAAYQLDMEVVSGGNSGTLSLLINEGRLPIGVNHLRLGASILMGIGLNDEPIKGLHQNTFKLVTEVIEVRRKPSVPVGDVGLDAFGRKPFFEDKGEIIRCICAVGRQDVNPDDLIPRDKNIEILGGSSDHLIIDVTQSEKTYKIGDKVSFDLTYGGCLSLMTSEYVQKYLIPIEE